MKSDTLDINIGNPWYKKGHYIMTSRGWAMVTKTRRGPWWKLLKRLGYDKTAIITVKLNKEPWKTPHQSC